jgi:phosphoglycolate phosphatase-like HAD superfamily hydrolase
MVTGGGSRALPRRDATPEASQLLGPGEVARYVGNTPAVCRASYIDPRVFDRFREGLTIGGVLPQLADVSASSLQGPVEDERGDDIRTAESALYFALIEEVEPMQGARDLLVDLKERGHTIVLASSAKAKEVEATKPRPDLVQAARERAGGGEAVMVGDTPWDCKAAAAAGVGTIAVLTGGFSRAELEDAGAPMVFESIAGLRERLEETPLAP